MAKKKKSEEPFGAKVLRSLIKALYQEHQFLRQRIRRLDRQIANSIQLYQDIYPNFPVPSRIKEDPKDK